MEEKIKKLKEVLTKYEQGMIRAGVNADDVNYDILADERRDRWEEIEKIMKD